jgi:serine/threonine protein kinase/predicted Zn-dependent protease
MTDSEDRHHREQDVRDGADEGSADDARLAGALQEYLAALEAGRKPSQPEFLARHADIAEALAEHLDGLEFMHAAAPPGGRTDQVAAELAGLPVGMLLGDFRLVREVGRGGMGVVYEAVQVSLERRVALKVLPFASTLDPRQLQRFQNEARAAAGLHHTHIVPVYAVGCERGVHFYAMQFVEGQTLAAVIAEQRNLVARKGGQGQPAANPLHAATVDQADGRVIPAPGAETVPVAGGLSTARSTKDAEWFRTVAGLGVQAAEALDHAHQQGVVHRDVKPGNLMVDDRGHLWVTDFGLAHVQHGPASLTMSGDLVGTLRYMSPEQTLAKRVVVDHRTDVYSLGATLYELLTLEPPFTGTDRQELLRQIAFEEPRPPRRLNKAIPAELEIIVLKALEKNPAERYATAQELADDLRRYLEHKPINAKRPSLTHRLGKWTRRNRGLVAGVVVVLFLTALGLGVSTFLLSRANARAQDNLDKDREARSRAIHAQDKAETEAAKANAVTRFLVQDLLLKASPDESGPQVKMTVAELLNQAAAKIDKAFPNQPEVEAQVRETIGVAYLNLGLYAEAEPHLRRAVDLYRTSVGPEKVETLRATDHLVSLLNMRNQCDEAERLGLPNFEACRRIMGSDHHLTGNALRHMVRLLQHRDTIDEAVTLLRQHLEIGLRLHRAGTTIDWTDLMLVLVEFLDYQRNFAEAEVLARWVVEFTQRYGRPNQVDAVFELAVVLQDQHRYDEAEALMRQAVERLRRERGPAHADTVKAIRQLADLLERQGGRSAEAEPLYREALETYRSLGPKETRDSLGVTLILTEALMVQGKFVEAEALAREALPTSQEFGAYLHAWALLNLSEILMATGRAAEAEPLLREALAIRRQLLFAGHPRVANAESMLGGCLTALQRYAEAEPLLLAGYETLHRADQLKLWALPRWRRKAHERLVKLYEAWDKPDKAQEWRAKEVPVEDSRVPPDKWAAELREARQKLYRMFWETCSADAATYNRYAWIMATSFDPELRDPPMAVQMARKAVQLAPDRPEPWDTLGAALYRNGEWRAAVEALQKANQILENGNSYIFLAMAHWQLGDREQAGQCFRKAVEWMGKNKPNPADEESLRRDRAEAAALLGIKDEPPGKQD